MKAKLVRPRKETLQLVAAPLLLAVLLAGMAVLAPVASATDPVLEVLEETLTLAPDEAGKWAATITLQNKGPALAGLTFEAVLVDGKGQPFERVLVLPAESLAAEAGCEGAKPCIDGYTVAQFTIGLRDDDASAIEEALSGHLFIETAGEAVTEAVALSLAPKAEDGDAKAFGFWRLNFASVIWVGLAAGALAFILSFVALILKYPGSDRQDLWGGHLGPIEWDFSKNWASTVTGLGGIAGTIYGLALLPETTKLLSKTEKIDEFTILATIFGLGVALVPVVGSVCTTLFPKKGQPGAARVWIYVLAASLVVWAAMGQTLVGLVFLDEVRQGSAAYSAVVFLLQGLLLVLGLAVFAYAVVKTVGTVLALIQKQKQPGAIKALRQHVVAAGNRIDTANYAQAVDDLKGQVRPLRWTLDSLEGTPRDEDQFKRITVAGICDLMLAKLDSFASDPDRVEKAKLLLTSMASPLDKVREALKNQVEKPQDVPAAIDALHAEVEKTLVLPRDAWDVAAAVNTLAALDRTPEDLAPVRIPAQPIYLP